MSNYERINDLVYMLSENVTLFLSVILVLRGKNNTKYPYHQEYEYTKFGEQVISIKRESSSLLVFRFSGYSEMMNDIALGAQHFELFYDVLEQCKNWFNGTWQVFCKKNDKLFIQRDNPLAKPKIISELINNAWISLEPIVIVGENDISSPGIRFTFSNGHKADVMVDRFYGLLHVLKGFNMYMATSLLLNYVNGCTPGTNLTQITGDNKFISNNNVSNNNKNKKSFFD